MEALRHQVPDRGHRAKEGAPLGGNKSAYTIRLALARVRQKYLHPRLPPEHARLLILHPPGNQFDKLNIELIPVSFADLGTRYQYEVLSYHWGAEQGLRTVQVRSDQDAANSTTPEAPSQLKGLRSVANQVLTKKMWLKINLYTALRRLRLPARPVVLWVDAICIDQDNAREKEEQVARMVEIYSRASRVVIWLGDEDDRSRSAIEFVQDIVRVDNLDGLITDHRTVKNWGDLVHLMQNAWFSRRWVIQEMAYANDATVHLAELALPWDDLRDAISLFVLNLDKIRALLRPLLELSAGLGQGLLLHDNLGSMDFLLRNNLDGLPAKVFFDVLDYMFRKPKRGLKRIPMHGMEFLVCTLFIYDNSDPRDTIHALRNIAIETSQAASDFYSGTAFPKPDYSNDLLDAYAGFVEWVVETTGSIDIICRRWARPEREKDGSNYPTPVKLPSWIQVATPEERTRRGTRSDSFVGLPGKRVYDASRTMVARVDFNLQQQTTLMMDDDLIVAERTAARQMAAHSYESIQVYNAFRLVTNDTRVVYNTSRAEQNDLESPSNSSNSTSKTTAQYDAPNPSSERRSSQSSDLSATDIQKILIIPQALRRRQRDASIMVRGMRIGKLRWTTDPITDGVIPDIALRKMRATAPGEPAPDQLWRTLVAERGEDGRNPPTWYYRACRYCLLNKSPNGHLNTDKLLSHVQPGIVRAFLQRVQAVTWNRRIVEVFVDGEPPLYGLAPADSRESDTVAILFGCSVPCILRLCQDDDGRWGYSLIGEACIYGLMDGEAIAAMNAEELEQKTVGFRLL